MRKDLGDDKIGRISDLFFKKLILMKSRDGKMGWVRWAGPLSPLFLAGLG
jgi:hypothetical protein